MGLKEVSVFAGISLTTICTIGAYASDINSISSAPPASTHAIQSVKSTEGAISQDEFVLRSSSEIANFYEVGVMNALGKTFLGISPHSTQTKIGSVAQELTGNANISYSQTASNSMIPECGPSRFSPAEIEALVGATAAVYAIDPGFAKAIAWTESRFDQVRNSLKGARGPMQLMPTTATALGVHDLCDPTSNIDGGVRHLKALLDEFRNPLLAAAAYNAGSRAVYDNNGIPPYGETVRYVATVINYQLGLELEQDEPSPRTTTVVKDRARSRAQASNSLTGQGSRFVKGVMHF